MVNPSTAATDNYKVFLDIVNSTHLVEVKIRETDGSGGRLYMTVAMTKKEAGVLESPVANTRVGSLIPASNEADVLGSSVTDELQANSLIPASEYKLSDVFANVNPADKYFLKCLPDGFLNEEQISAKREAPAIRRVNALLQKLFTKMLAIF